MEAIRKAAVRLIFDHGFEAMNLRQLAAEVGLQPGSLYNHIKTKQDLLYGLLETVMQDLLAEVDKALGNLTDPVERMRAFVAFHIDFHTARKRDVFIGNMELRSLTPAHRRKISALRSAYEDRLTQIIASGARSRQFAAADARVATFAIIAMLTGVCTWYDPKGRLSRDRLVAIYTDLVLGALQSEKLPHEGLSRR